MSICKEEKLVIGMPVFNGAKTIGDALGSLLAQTCGEFKVLVSDNGSTDGTPRLVRQFAKKDTRVRLSIQDENIGPAANFDYVFKNSDSKYFMWAASDDRWSPDFVEKGIRILDTDDDVGFVFPTFKLESWSLPLRKKIDPNLFALVEHPDSRVRVLKFANLHHMSHKCNLVYSLFRRDVLATAYARQDLNDETLLAMVILEISRGKRMDSFSFSKRYAVLWPGLFIPMLKVARRLARKPSLEEQTRLAIAEHLRRALIEFPEYSQELQAIKCAWKMEEFRASYQIADPVTLGLE